MLFALLAPERKSTLVFCVNLAHVGQLTQTFRSAGIDARYVHSGTPMAERRALIEGFKAGVYPVLLNCGTHLRPVQVALCSQSTSDTHRRYGHPEYRLRDRRSTYTLAKYICANGTSYHRSARRPSYFAQIGRGMRLSPATGKVDCHIIDFVDITTRIPGVVCTPTLFGLDPSEVVDSKVLPAAMSSIPQNCVYRHDHRRFGEARGCADSIRWSAALYGYRGRHSRSHDRHLY